MGKGIPIAGNTGSPRERIACLQNTSSPQDLGTRHSTEDIHPNVNRGANANLQREEQILNGQKGCLDHCTSETVAERAQSREHG